MTQPKPLTVGELRKFLDLYKDELQVTVKMPNGEYVGVLDASTALLTGRKLVFTMKTTTDTSGQQVSPVSVA